MIFVSKMRGFGLVISEVKPIWIKLYDHSANVPRVLGVSVAPNARDFEKLLNSGTRRSRVGYLQHSTHTIINCEHIPLNYIVYYIQTL